MLTKQIAILLLFCVLVSTLSKSLLLAHYAANLNYYEKVLCENKAKPVMKCSGKCQLKKEMTNDDKKQNLPGNNIKSESSTVLFVEPLLSSLFFIQAVNHFYHVPANGIIEGFNHSIFHPPSTLI